MKRSIRIWTLPFISLGILLGIFGTTYPECICPSNEICACPAAVPNHWLNSVGILIAIAAAIVLVFSYMKPVSEEPARQFQTEAGF